MKKVFAFTLAETLIVMGIIGIVSALTLPNLNSSTAEKEKVAKVKKLYQNLSDTCGRASAIYGPVNTWFGSDTSNELMAKRFGERITEFLKVSKNCGFNKNGCFADIDSTDGPLLYFNDMPKYEVILADGTSLAMYAFPVGYQKGTFDFAKIYIDIDGPNKGKNKMGIDIFDFSLESKDGLLYPSRIQSPYTRNLSGNLDENTKANYVTAWVIMNENLDYLKCSNLNWQNKTSCK